MSLYDLMPRDKLIKRGSSSLGDIELLQVFIGSGIQGRDYKFIAKELMATINRVGFDNLTIDDLKRIKGIGDSKATSLFAVLEFARRRYEDSPKPVVDSPEKAADQFSYISEKKQEYFSALTLDGARRLINRHTVSIGTLMSSLVHPRELFALAIEDRAASIIIGHNHPSGLLEVSAQDRDVTRRIRQAGDIIGIRLDDHIIVSKHDFISAY
jgi:DNA repair protein RadC